MQISQLLSPVPFCTLVSDQSDQTKTLAEINPTQSIDMKRSLLGQSFIFMTLFINLAISQSIDGSSNWPGVNSRKSIASMNLNKRTYPSHQPSAELQTIMSGNWHKMNPESLFKLLNTLATSKETLPDDYYGYDDNSFEDDDPIDLVYSGRSKPFLQESSSTNPTWSSSSHSGGPPLAEPISIMSSNMHNLENDNGYGVAQPLQKHRLIEKLYHPFPMKRSSFINDRILGLSSTRNVDLVQLPTGEIAFTPQGIQVLRHQPIRSVDERFPLLRRPVL